jgi:YebC/PmpR family DNA-binding regulatory protein
MAGHSHSANIAARKGKVDAARGKLFSKLSRAIIVAARNGGGDPDMNLKLRYAIDKARSASMPKDNIERAIKRGTGELEGMTYEEIMYEGYGPGGVAIMTDVLTDNRARTAGEIRRVFEKGGGNLGSAGCVAFLFERKGLLSVPRSAADEDTVMSVALDAGADDMKVTETAYEVVCDPHTFNEVKAALEKSALTLTVAEITQLPKVQVDTDTDTGQRVLRLMEALHEHDDVQNVYSNINLTDEMVAAAEKG